MNLKKPKFWNLSQPNLYAILLFPLAFLIQLVSKLKISSEPKKFKIKTICIGNIYVGGTGKTSLSLALNNILKKNKIKSCFVKKFYKDQINIKGKTTEKLGVIGKEKAIACEVICSVIKYD